MEFRNVVFNAARDGKLRRLKVRKLQFYIVIAINTKYFQNENHRTTFFVKIRSSHIFIQIGIPDVP